VSDDKKVVLFTGSPGRLGSAFCEKYYDDYTIVGTARRKQANFAHHFIQADIREDCDRVVSEALDKFGRVDVLVNSAAVYAVKPILKLEPEEMAELFRTNVVAPFALARCLLRNFWAASPDENRRRDRGVINLSSVSATNVYPRQAAYASSKAALNMLTRHMAAEFGEYGVRVNALSPTTFPGIVSCERVADALVELERSGATGQIIEITE
jgi:3-oxoacyl-[acyl-carrier protein] reductase